MTAPTSRPPSSPAAEDRCVVEVTELEAFARRVLTTVGMPADHARSTAAAMTWADRRGLAAHGVAGKLPQCVDRIRAGGSRARPDIRVVTDFGAAALLDADDAWGQVAGVQAMRSAISRAHEHGIGAVSVRRTSSAAALGHFAWLAARRGLIGVAVTNGPALIAAPEGVRPVVGNQAHAIAGPGGDGEENIVLYDASTGVLSAGVLEEAARAGREIPAGMLRDAEGEPTRDPRGWRSGCLEAIGGHHGYGLSIGLELLTGMLAGTGAMAPDVGWPDQPDRPQQVSLWCMALRCDLGRSTGQFVSDVERLRALVAGSGRPGGAAPRLPGERSNLAAHHNRDRLSYTRAQQERLLRTASRLSVRPPAAWS